MDFCGFIGEFVFLVGVLLDELFKDLFFCGFDIGFVFLVGVLLDVLFIDFFSVGVIFFFLSYVL